MVEVAVAVEQMDEGHLVGHEVVVHVLDVDDYGRVHGHGGVGDAVVRRPLVLPDPKIYISNKPKS